MDPVQPNILNLKGITKRFSHAPRAAVNQVTFALNQGNILALLGPSGCGKTTLLRIIAGFERAQAGTLEVNGHSVAGPHTWVEPEQRCVGMVFQDCALFPHLSVAENVKFGLTRTGSRGKRQATTRVAEVLKLVGLQGMERRYPHELSGGQQQRIALARALAPQPNLVLLDEPLSSLDVQVRLHLRQELRTILKAAGTSAVFVTHDQEEALVIADRVAVMRDGCIEQLGTPEEIYRQPASQFVAEFVTQANFLPAHRQGDYWQTEVGAFKGDPHPDLNSTQAHTGILMIRQEDLNLHPDERAATVIRDRQFLGREYRYCLQTSSGQELHARTTCLTNLPIGTAVQLSVTAQDLRVFPYAYVPSSTLETVGLSAY